VRSGRELACADPPRRSLQARGYRTGGRSARRSAARPPGGAMAAAQAVARRALLALAGLPADQHRADQVAPHGRLAGAPLEALDRAAAPHARPLGQSLGEAALLLERSQ